MNKDWFEGDEFARHIFNNKYALPKDNRRETLEEVFKRVSTYIAQAEPTQELKTYWADEWERMIFNKEFFPGGRIMHGADNPSKVSMINCTTVQIGRDRKGLILDPDSLEGIFEAAYMVGRVESRGEGVGIDVSSLRPSGATTKNAAETSTGAVSWMSLYSMVTGLIAQHGRRGALLISMEDKHPDIEKFIDIKQDHREVQFANISVKISDKLMSAYHNDDVFNLEWNTVYKTVKAKDLIRQLATSAYNCAEPGVLFWDTSKRLSNSDAVGFPVVGVNACSEQVLSHGSSCTLSNINLSNLSLDIDKACTEVYSRAGKVLRFLDNVVEMQLRDKRCPTPIQEFDLRCLRRVGVGYTGLGDYLTKAGVPYDSDEGIEIAERLTKSMMLGSYYASMELARERGSFPAFDWNKYKQSGFIKNLLDSNCFSEKFFEGGMRNVCCNTIPPTGTGAIMMGVSSGVEPIMDTWYYRRTRVVSKKYAEKWPSSDRAKFNEPGDESCWRWEMIVHPSILKEMRTEVPNFDSLNDEEKIEKIDARFPKSSIRAAHEIDYNKKLLMMSRIQKWIDSSISVTYNLDENAKIQDVEDIYVKAHDLGLKGCSVYVSHPNNREPVIMFRQKPKTWNFSFKFLEKYGNPYAE